MLLLSRQWPSRKPAVIWRRGAWLSDRLRAGHHCVREISEERRIVDITDFEKKTDRVYIVQTQQWNWLKQANRDGGRRVDGLTSEEHDELLRLRRESRQLRRERDILAKAAV